MNVTHPTLLQTPCSTRKLTSQSPRCSSFSSSAAGQKAWILEAICATDPDPMDLARAVHKLLDLWTLNPSGRSCSLNRSNGRHRNQLVTQELCPETMPLPATRNTNPLISFIHRAKPPLVEGCVGQGLDTRSQDGPPVDCSLPCAVKNTYSTRAFHPQDMSQGFLHQFQRPALIDDLPHFLLPVVFFQDLQQPALPLRSRPAPRLASTTMHVRFTDYRFWTYIIKATMARCPRLFFSLSNAFEHSDPA